ncbi:MAG: ABC transporter substrate-binding protein [Clostridia bacterium]|nr:ABC transporter substrate-binding protein [Clostridia bacterium]
MAFHNGAELTAYDVQASYEAFKNAGRTNPYSLHLEQFVKSLEAVDDLTVRVVGNFAGYIVLYAMDFPVIQSSTINDDLPRGTGPFWYVAMETDSAIRLEPNALWWKQQPTVHSVTFCRYAESGDAIQALQTNAIEMLSTRSPAAALSRKLADMTSMDYGTTTYEMMVPNLGDSSVMSDVRMRQAVMYAIDRSVLANNAYLDMAIQSEVPVLPGSWLYESRSAVYYYSPERSLQLLYDMGWDDLTGDTRLNKRDGIRLIDLEVNIITYNEASSSVRENAANTIASYLNAVGIKTKVEVLSSAAAVRQRMKDREYDLALIGVNLSEIPVLQPLLGTSANLNFNRYSNESMDSLIAYTATVEDEDGLRQTYSEIQMNAVDRLPILGLLFRTGTVLSSRSLGAMNGIRSTNVFRGMEYLTE